MPGAPSCLKVICAIQIGRIRFCEKNTEKFTKVYKLINIGIQNTDKLINIGIQNTDMKIENLARQNPWWKGKDGIVEDFDIQKWNGAKRRWVPDLISKVRIEPFSLHFLLGPRQAGKTTAAKLLIRQFLQTMQPQSLFYFNCEELKDFKELTDVAETYLSFKDAHEIKTSLIILDEVTSVKEWYRGVKFLVDTGRLRNEVLFLTGSMSLNIKKDTELFPGRRGKGQDFILFPLSFREFLKVINPNLFAKLSSTQKMEGTEKAIMKNSIFLKELNTEFTKYMRFGGFPLAIEAIDGSKEYAKQVYLSWIKSTILKAGRDDAIARQIIKSTIEKMPSDMSWEGISKEIEIKSPKTVSAYLNLMKSMYAIFILYNTDISKKLIKFGKNKKIHVSDPLLLEIFEDWCLATLKNKESILAESITVSHLSRTFPEKIFFWRNGSEVDVILLEKKRLYGFEVKWGDKSAAKVPSQIKNFITLTREEFSPNKRKFPLSVFLASLTAK